VMVTPLGILVKSKVIKDRALSEREDFTISHSDPKLSFGDACMILASALAGIVVVISALTPAAKSDVSMTTHSRHIIANPNLRNWNITEYKLRIDGYIAYETKFYNK